MVAREIVHASLSSQPPLDRLYLQLSTRCAPQGSITRNGWQREYLVSDRASVVTCKKCLKGMR